MKNQINNIEIMACMSLDNSELEKIDGGSEASDAFWNGLGQICGHVYNGVKKFIATDHGGAGVIAL
ncbi:MAG: hypothetical protein CFE22_14975 [Cytophagaceae bacterium BCCC1]|nr:MAG: hypothetical protein CFE22_14975 [Cytophagaceae bacterium BCCC1]